MNSVALLRCLCKRKQWKRNFYTLSTQWIRGSYSLVGSDESFDRFEDIWQRGCGPNWPVVAIKSSWFTRLSCHVGFFRPPHSLTKKGTPVGCAVAATPATSKWLSLAGPNIFSLVWSGMAWLKRVWLFGCQFCPVTPVSDHILTSKTSKIGLNWIGRLRIKMYKTSCWA